jgi:hypothetical protein
LALSGIAGLLEVHQCYHYWAIFLWTQMTNGSHYRLDTQLFIYRRKEAGLCNCTLLHYRFRIPSPLCYFCKNISFNIFLTFKNPSLKLETVSLFQHMKIKAGCLTYVSNFNIIFSRTLDSWTKFIIYQIYLEIIINHQN